MTVTRRSRAALKATSAILSAALVLSLFAAPALAQAIAVQGNSRVDADTIRSYFSGGRDQASIDRGIRDMYATGLFSNVRVTRTGGGLLVSVTENAIVNRVTILGNSRVKTDQLFAEIQTRSRGPFSQAMVNADVERILEIYRRVGRSDARVDVTTATAPNGRIDVTFRISEGSKTGVNVIRFEGNRAFSDWRLKNVMETTEANIFSFLKTSDVYDPDKIASDVDRIRRFYLRNGYVDFRVLGTNAVYDEARKGYVVTISLDEGEQYRVGSVTVDSRIEGIDAATVRRRVQTSEGAVYNAELVEKTVEQVTMDAARQGFPFAQVRPRGDRDPANRVVNLGFTLDEGPRIYIERINIRGNTRTRDYVIRREFDLGEGDAYNRALIDRAERRLKGLAYFKNVRITQEPGSTPDRVVVNVDVEDQPTGQFSIGGGYSTSDGFIAEASVAEQNFLGRGQQVRLGFTYGQRTRGAEFSFTEPYFLDRRLSAGFDIFSRYADLRDQARYTTQTTGGALRIGLPITDEIGIGLRYSLFSTDVKIPNTSREPYNDCNVPIAGITPPLAGFPVSASFNCLTNGEASLAVKESLGRTITSALGLALVYTNLDNVQNPTSGLTAELRIDAAGLGGDSRFVRATGEVRYYYPIADDVTGLLKFSAGRVQGFGGYRLRQGDHFNLGPSLVRGFAAGGIGPRDMSFDPRTGSLGGTTFIGASAEVQFPIWGIPKEVGLRGAVFADAGTLFGYGGHTRFNVIGNRVIGTDGTGGILNTTTGVFTPGCQATLAAPTFTQGNCIALRDQRIIRSSIGAGLLWQSPLGPIRFDFAYALSKDKFDRPQVFRFSGGGRF